MRFACFASIALPCALAIVVRTSTAATADPVVLSLEQFQDIDPPGSTFVGAVVRLSNSGDVTGFYHAPHGDPFFSQQLNFHYDAAQGVYSDIDLVPGFFDVILGANDHGVMTGYYLDAAFDQHPVVYDSRSSTSQVLSDPSLKQLMDINNAGLSVGVAEDDRGAGLGFLYNTVSGELSDIANPSADIVSLTPHGINDRGQVVGTILTRVRSRGFLYENGKFTFLDVPGAQGTDAVSLNNRGMVVGIYGPHSFLYYRGTYFTFELPAGALSLQISDINDSGQVSGQYAGDDNLLHGFVAQVPVHLLQRRR